ncbi:hypothetical protein B9Z19DRAFT_1073188 [Tuber borchii]|uniref:Uncharacterized protein n=1 Tax=Tuber borchii TaxID=42251 RepID=A0A2T7A642_TUBBO|nr:hypothetical protein B9Z19DRAFT_1073188 [Tuber borchii]
MVPLKNSFSKQKKLEKTCHYFPLFASDGFLFEFAFGGVATVRVLFLPYFSGTLLYL